MNVRLTKLSKNNNSMRTNEIEGYAEGLPQIERGYQVVGKSLTSDADARYVKTSAVQAITKTKGGYMIDTLNSTYLVEVLDATN